MPPRPTRPTGNDFEQVYRHYRGSVHRQAERLIGDYHEAEDASQEIFLRIYTRWATLKNGDALPLWVKRIARNTAIDLHRRRRRVRVLPLVRDVPGPDGDSESPERLLPDLVTALERLPLTLGVTLLLFAVERLDPCEISDLTCTNPGTVKVRLHRARSLMVRKWNGLRGSGEMGPSEVSRGPVARPPVARPPLAKRSIARLSGTTPSGTSRSGTTAPGRTGACRSP